MLNLKRSLVLFAVLLGLLTAGIVSAKGSKVKSYEITISSAMKVGTVVLAPGEYKFKLDGSNAVFVKSRGGDTFTTPAKIEDGEDNYGRTVLRTVQDGDQTRIIGIALKGTKSMMKFN